MADSIVIKREGRNEPSWVSYVKGRISKNKNMIIHMSGKVGSGKSWTALSIARQLDASFNADKVVFGLRGLMNLINSGENFKAGTAFVWDEFQIDASNRNWQSLTNKLLNSLLSTFRHRRFILIITAPYSDFLDSNSRKLVDAELECVKIDYTTKKVKVKPQLLQYNSRYKKFYYKYLRIRDSRGLVSPLKAWNVQRPPKDLILEYEKLKTNFTNELNADIQRQLDELEGKKSKQPLTAIQENVIKFMAEYKDIAKVSELLKISERTIQFHIAQAKKKGYTPDNYTQNTLKTAYVSEKPLQYDAITQKDGTI